MKTCLLLLISSFILTINTNAQEGIESIFLADKEDSQKLMQAYFAPAMEGFIYGMNNGWYHTAKVHKLLGFDISVGLSASIIPKAKEFFNISKLGLKTTTSNATMASTFAGPNETTKMTVTTTINGKQGLVDFDMPGGITEDLPLNAVPAPIGQFNIGLPKKFELMARVVPKVKIGDDGGSVSLLGLGVKKEITDWFGLMRKVPLHISLLAAYTKMDVSYGFEDTSSGELQIKDALAEFNLKAFTFQVIASLNFPIINIYGGIGYSSGNSEFKTNGTFIGEYTDFDTNQIISKTLDIPDALSFKASGIKTTGGVRLSLGPLKIFADYTLQEYNTISAGVSIGIR